MQPVTEEKLMTYSGQQGQKISTVSWPYSFAEFDKRKKKKISTTQQCMNRDLKAFLQGKHRGGSLYIQGVHKGSLQFNTFLTKANEHTRRY